MTSSITWSASINFFSNSKINSDTYKNFKTQVISSKNQSCAGLNGFVGLYFEIKTI